MENRKPLTPNLRETIRSLKRDGWTISELASRFNRTETEIEQVNDFDYIIQDKNLEDLDKAAEEVVRMEENYEGGFYE